MTKERDKEIIDIGEAGPIKKTEIVGTGGVTIGGSGSPEFIKPKPQEERATSTSSGEIPPLPPEKGLTHYQSSLHVEHQFFGNIKKRAEQLWLDFEGVTSIQAQQKASEITGLDLSLTGQVALHGLSILLARSQYKGNISPSEVDTSLFGRGIAPNISITLPEFYEACGAKRNKEGKYTGKAVMDLKKALFEELGKDRTVCMEKRYYKKGKERVNVLQGTIKLINILNYYEFSSEEYLANKKALHRGELDQTKARGYVITFHPIVLEEIKTFYSLIPFTLYRDIKAILPGYRGKAVPLFIRWLLSLDMPEFKVSQAKLAQVLWLDYLLNPPDGSGPQKKRLKEEHLDKCFKAAKELGFVLDIQERYGGKQYFIKLNPEQCQRVKRKLIEHKPEE